VTVSERWHPLFSPCLVKGPWSQDEDQLLVRLYGEHGRKLKPKIRRPISDAADPRSAAFVEDKAG
jgi:hypothetical protein